MVSESRYGRNSMVTKLGVDPDPARRLRLRQGASIRTCRKLRDMTIAEFAEKLNVSEGAVSQWETGRFSPRQPMQIKIARVLNVPWSLLFSLDEAA